jgi:hypothetical protein
LFVISPENQQCTVVCDLASIGWQIHRLVQSILGILRMKGREEIGDEDDEGEREMGGVQ